MKRKQSGDCLLEQSDDCDETASVERNNNPVLPSTVKELLYSDCSTVSNEELVNDGVELSESELAYTNKSKLYLVGTAHFSRESQQDVEKLILDVQPDVVMVELCPSRIGILSMDEETLLEEAKNLNREKIVTTIKQSGVVQGVMHLMLLSMSAYVTKELGMAPGGEFRAAFKAARNVSDCRTVLGDRPIQVTLQRALSALGCWQKLRLFWHILLGLNSSITKEDVERCKQKDLLEELLREMAGEFPALTRIFVDERDRYMAYGLRTLLRNAAYRKLKRMRPRRGDSNAAAVLPSSVDDVDVANLRPIVAVGVVGIGHSVGIGKYWDEHVDIEPLLYIPPPSKLRRYVGFGIVGALLGIGGYRCLRFAYRSLMR